TAVNQTYEARFVIPEGFENLLFNVVDEDIIVIGIIDRMVTEIIIPDSVTKILEGALSGCSNLTYLSLPFIGKEQHLAGEARLETNEYLLGYIFGYNPYSNSVSVTQSYEADGDIVDMRYQIPSTLRTVVLRGGNRIGYCAFQNCSMLENIYIPSTITHIDEVAFFGCSGLTSFTYPTGLLEIGDSAFYLCTSLEEVTLPNTLTALGYNAFTNCSSLATLNYVDDSVILGNNVFTGTAIQNANISTNIISIMTKTNLVNLTIHGSTIPTNAFSSCNNLKNVTLIDVTTIETNAFLSCHSLEKVIVNSIEDWCNITFASTSSNPLYYAHELYIGDELLTDIVIPDSITTLHNYVFTQGTSFKSIVIPNSVEEIGLDILNGCNALESVTIPFVGFTRPNSENVSDHRPFGHLFGTNQNRGDICQHWPSNPSVDYWYVIPESLKTVTVTDSTYIPDYAFQNCRMLVNINLPNEVTYIGQQAFRSCTNLSQFILPSDIDTIGSHAFIECYRLVEIVNHSSKSLTLNDDTNGYIAYYAKGIISDEANSLLTTTEDGLVIYNGTILVNYLGSGEDLFIDSQITEIHNFAFMYNKIIEIVTLCDAITAIGKYAFFQCSSLEEINIPYQVTEIKESTFDQCDKLSVIAIEGVITRIEQNAFRYVIVEEIDLDNGLEYIGNFAFANSQISTINYYGTIAEWNLISKSDDWNNVSCLSTISCTDGCILL
ncbi:MAG: leucine-rich repeat protein, partial [Bacilli bacterium]|nr:leucine-rich repeat protein [Bacilli bacterium]